LGRLQFKASPSKQGDSISTNKKLSMEACACHLSYVRSVTGRILIQATLGIKERLYLKNN
jgi:hypothetical protein